jgi:hypothetical protein
MVSLIPDDGKFWQKAAEHYSAEDLEELRAFLASLLSRPNYELVAGGLDRDTGPTIKIRITHPKHGIRADIDFIGIEFRKAISTLQFWIQYGLHDDLDESLEKHLRSILGSDTREWHYLDTKDLGEQIDLVRKALDKVEAFEKGQ